MYTYKLTQWVLFFVVYAFLGWVWESCYVSVKSRQWVNRGFMNGPVLPIYGFGANAILWATLAVRDYVILVYLLGMLSATLLEYVTGAAMERLFKVRYWDYSEHRFNLHGHICLSVSLGWGVFSVFLVEVIHVPIEHLILAIPDLLSDILAIVALVCMASDFTASFNEAMDLREVLVRLSESREQIAKLQRRLEIISTVAVDDYNRIRQERNEKRQSRRQAFAERLQANREVRRKQLEELQAKLEELQQRGKAWKETRDFQRQISEEFQHLGARTDKMYGRAVRHLRRNPGIATKKYADAVQELKELLKRK
jgi:uncharacterized membrane protein